MTDSWQHLCNAKGCEVRVQEGTFMCNRHWHMLTRRLRQAMIRANSPGPSREGSPEYNDLCWEAIAFVAEREGKT